MAFRLLGWELKVGTTWRRVKEVEEEDGESRMSLLDVMDKEHVPW